MNLNMSNINFVWMYLNILIKTLKFVWISLSYFFTQLCQSYNTRGRLLLCEHISWTTRRKPTPHTGYVWPFVSYPNTAVSLVSACKTVANNAVVNVTLLKQSMSTVVTWFITWHCLLSTTEPGCSCLGKHVFGLVVLLGDCEVPGCTAL